MITASAAAYRATCDITSKFKSCIYAWPSGTDASAHTRLRYKVVFTFQVASISSSPSPSQSPGICRNKPGINSFLFP